MMHSLNEFAVVYVLNALWQTTLLLLGTELVVRWLKPARAVVTHRLCVSCLLLAVVLPATPLARKAIYEWGLTPHVMTRTSATHVDLEHGRMRREMGMPQETGTYGKAISDGPQLSFGDDAVAARTDEKRGQKIAWTRVPVRALEWMYWASVLFALVKLAWALWRTVLLRRRARTAVLSETTQGLWAMCCAGFGLRGVLLLQSESVVSPATMTLRRPVVLLPRVMEGADEAALAAVFCHELAHVRRGDFLKNLLYELLAAPLFFHPAAYWMRRRVQETRELACDDMAAEVLDGRNAYASSLVRLAETMTATVVTSGRALGVFDGNVLEKRIMNLIEARVKQVGWRAAMPVVCGVLILVLSCMVGARFGLRPVFAKVVSTTQPVVSAVVMTPAKAAAVVANVDTNATLEKDHEASDASASEAVTPESMGPEQEVASNEAAQPAPTPQAAPKYPDPGDMKPVIFKLGQTNFLPGDAIAIDQIRGTSDKVVQGNVYEIKGHYTLVSHEDALLAASVTVSRDAAHGHESPSVNMSVNKGDGHFNVWLFLGEEGQPHLSFYPTSGGNSFASVYFASDLTDAGTAIAPVVSTGQTREVPKGWWLGGSKADSYVVGLDNNVMHDGQKSAYMSAVKYETGGFGSLGQSFLATAYQGKRIRLRAWVKSKDVRDWAGLWMRVDEGDKVLSLDNMQERAIKGTTDWKVYDVVLDVPKKATGIAMGVLLTGPGTVWISGVNVESVGSDVALTKTFDVTPAAPVNLDFGK